MKIFKVRHLWLIVSVGYMYFFYVDYTSPDHYMIGPKADLVFDVFYAIYFAWLALRKPALQNMRVYGEIG